MQVAPLPATLPELMPELRQEPGATGGRLDPEDCPDQVAGEKAHSRGAAFRIGAAAALACLVVLGVVLVVALHSSSSSSSQAMKATATTQAAGVTAAAAAGTLHNVNITAFPGVSGTRPGVDYNQAFRDGTYVDAANPTAAEIQAVVDAANGKGGQTNNTGV